MPYQTPHWRVKPAEFLSRRINRQGPGSLHAYLKKKDWITSFSSDDETWARGVSMLTLYLELTRSGFGQFLLCSVANDGHLNVP